MSTRHRLRWGFTVPAILAMVMALAWTLIGLPGWTGTAKAAPAGKLSAAVTPPVACDKKDSPDKGWIQVFYVYRNGESRFEEMRDTVKRIAWNIDQTFEASAQRFGQGDSRRLRFVQDDNCQIEVTPIGADLPDKLSLGEARGHADDWIKEHLVKDDSGYFGRHKPVYFVDAEGVDGCGLGGGAHAGGLGGGWGGVTFGCWGEQALTHELIHAFGLNHCNGADDQGNDPICRGADQTPRCDDLLAGTVLDCAKDEFAYFHPRPAPGSPLAENPEGNIANSPYLIKNQPAPPVDAQLVGTKGQCLASGGAGKAAAQKECGDDTVWRRTISTDGYFQLELKGTKQCLSSTESGDKAHVLSACDKGDERQHWMMFDAAGPDKEHYRLANRATKEEARIADESEFKMHFSVGSATTDTEGTEPTSDEPSEQGAEPQSDGTKPASSDADLAATGGDMGTSVSIAIGALALAVLGGAILMKTRRKRAASSHRAR
ncbi:hypothetical protein BN159_2567 [Streptomyces davaonensis JCM 4913]|uniref:Ricin B lectin domain-containing protein n=1 Tax=Streptomyces davaonensis (strain DSM 101723 / JCM 4913 / KCC S-0913 / 768) TaxID=1214101 RepID=K4QTT2_STRDJ|nr:LPXTG cell wall anchor domain-containing protein [Streptomyces davaonensis]CCK26946.1 hypothetical protein BN159_2567 [Streptomyces davaonensis JCM 4913]